MTGLDEKPDALAMLREWSVAVQNAGLDSAAIHFREIELALLAERAEHEREVAELEARWRLWDTHISNEEHERLLGLAAEARASSAKLAAVEALVDPFCSILLMGRLRAALATGEKVSAPEAWTWTDRKVAEFCENMHWTYKEGLIEHIERFKDGYSPAFWEPPKPLEQRQCLTCEERFEGAVDGSTPCPHCNAVQGHCTKCGAFWDRNTHTHMTGVDDYGNVECETILTSTIINRSL